MGDPVFWLSISLLLVCVSLAVAIAIAIPALQELSRAARSAEKLFDTLTRELPPTLEAIRLTGGEGGSQLRRGTTAGAPSWGVIPSHSGRNAGRMAIAHPQQKTAIARKTTNKRRTLR